MPVCEQCGKYFESTQGNPNRFCSKECAGRYIGNHHSEEFKKKKSEAWKGENNPRYKPKIKKKCENCGEIFKVSPYESDKKFCSSKCQRLGQTKREERECAYCGEKFEVVPSSKKKYCSKRCSGKANGFQPTLDIKKDKLLKLYWKEGKGFQELASLFECSVGGLWRVFERYDIERRPNFSSEDWSSPSGEEHPLYKNGKWIGGAGPEYGSNWAEQRKKALRRDNHTCQLCGVEEDGREHDIHHIKSITKFDNPKEGNRLDNLITLCRSCHPKVEQNPSLIQTMPNS